MPNLSVKAGSTSQTITVFVQDSTVAYPKGLTGLVFNTASLSAYFCFVNAAPVAITLATLAAVNSAWSSGGFKEMDATNMPGVYRLDIPDAALAAASGREVTILLKGATNMANCVNQIELTGWDNTDAVRGGMTALPNAAAAASGGLLINGVNTGTVTLAALTVTAATTLTGNVSMAAGLTITQSTSNTAGVAITGNGTGAGMTVTGGATGSGVRMIGGATSGDGLYASGPTSGHGINPIGTGSGKHGLGGVLETGFDFTQGLQLMLSALAGKSSETAGTVTFRDVADAADRIVAVTDGSGQRSSMTFTV